MTKLQPRVTRPQGLTEEPQEIAAPAPRRREFNDMRFQVVDQATQLDFVDTTRQPVFEILKKVSRLSKAARTGSPRPTWLTIAPSG